MGVVPNFIVFFEHLTCFLEVEAFEAPDLDCVIFQTPLLGLQWDDIIHLFEKLRDCSTGRVQWAKAARRPENTCNRQSISLNDQVQPHVSGNKCNGGGGMTNAGGRMWSRNASRLSGSDILRFWAYCKICHIFYAFRFT